MMQGNRIWSLRLLKAGSASWGSGAINSDRGSRNAEELASVRSFARSKGSSAVNHLPNFSYAIALVRLLLRLYGDHGFGHDQQASHGGGILECHADYLDRINHSELEHVAILPALSVEAPVRVILVGQFANHDRAVRAGVDGDLPGRRMNGAADDVDA